MTWDAAMHADTTPVFNPDHEYDLPTMQAREHLFEHWRAGDQRRSGVMARQGFYAGFNAAMKHIEDERNG